MKSIESELDLTPVAYFHSCFVNTPEGLKAKVFFNQFATIIYPDHDIVKVFQDELNDVAKRFNRILEWGRKYSQPSEDTIKVIAPRLPVSQNYPPRALKPLVENGILKVSFTVVEEIANFLLFGAKTPNVMYEVVDYDILVIRDENNMYFKVITTWSEEAEEEGWENQAKFEHE